MRFRDRQTRVTQVTVALFDAGRSWTGCRCGRDPRIQATRPSIGISAAPALIRSRLRTALDCLLVPGRESNTSHNMLFCIYFEYHNLRVTPKVTPLLLTLPSNSHDLAVPRPNEEHCAQAGFGTRISAGSALTHPDPTTSSGIGLHSCHHSVVKV